MGNLGLMNKVILITGGSGYLGTKLRKALEFEGAIVFNISKGCKESSHDFDIDISDFEEFEKIIVEINPEIIYHLAANIDRSRDFDKFDKINAVNSIGTLNLLKSLKNIDYENLIFTSTSEVYGNGKSPFSEENIPEPVSPYSLTKLFAENLIKTYSNLHQKNFTILRLFNFYGNEMPESFFIPQIIKTLMRNEPFLMTGGEQKRDFVHVNDVVESLIISALNPNANNQTFNVCSGKAVQLNELAATVAESLDKKNLLMVGSLPYRENEVWEMVGNPTKIFKSLGFRPKINLKQGITSVVESLTF